MRQPVRLSVGLPTCVQRQRLIPGAAAVHDGHVGGRVVSAVCIVLRDQQALGGRGRFRAGRSAEGMGEFRGELPPLGAIARKSLRLDALGGWVK